MQHNFSGEKYTVINDNGKLTALRHGEHWRDLCGDNLIASMLNKVDNLKAALNEVNNWLVCAPIASAEDMAQSFTHMQNVCQGALDD